MERQERNPEQTASELHLPQAAAWGCGRALGSSAALVGSASTTATHGPLGREFQPVSIRVWLQMWQSEVLCTAHPALSGLHALVR